MKPGSCRRLLASFASVLAWATTACSAPVPPAPPAPAAHPAPEAVAPRLLETPALLLQDIPGNPAEIALDPRGELLAMATKSVVVMRPRDGAVVARFAPFKTVVTSLRFADDGKTLLAVTRGGEVRLWDVERDALLLDARLGPTLNDERVDPEVTIGDGSTFAVIADRAAFMVVDLRTGEKRIEGPIRPGGTTVRVEGGFASVASADGVVTIRRLADGATLAQRDLGGCRTHRPAPDGAHVLVSMCPDETTKLLHVASGRVVWARKQVATISEVGLAIAKRDVVARVGSDLVDLVRDRVIARSVAAFALSPDGRVAVVHRNGRAELGRLGEKGLHGTIALGEISGAMRTIAFRERTVRFETPAMLAVFDVENGRPLGRFDTTGTEQATYWPASSTAAWVACTSDTSGHCESIRFARATPAGTSRWDSTLTAPVGSMPIEGTDGVLVSCPTGAPLLFEPAGVSVLDPKIAPVGTLPWIASANADGSVVALGTNAGVSLWSRSSGDVRAIPTVTWVERERSPEIRWQPAGRSFVVHRAPHFPPDPDVVETAFLHVDGAEAPVELRPRHAWASVGFHPTEPLVFLNSGYGSMYNVMAWAGSDVTVFGFDGRVLGRLAGHTATTGRTGKFIAVLRGHPSRSAEGASTQLLDGRTRRPILRRPGHPVAWADDDGWVVMRTSPRGFTNAPAGPDMYTLYELPSGAERGAVTTEGSVSVDPSSAVATITEESEGNDRRSRIDLKTGASLADSEPRDATTSRAQHNEPLALDPTSRGVQLKNGSTGRTIDVHVRASSDAQGCQWLVQDSEGDAEGDVASFFRVRRHADLRTAPLEAPSGATMPKTRKGILRDLVTR